MKTGIMVASSKEMAPFIELLKGIPITVAPSKAYEVRTFALKPDETVYLILSGFGEIAAASSTQYLIDIFHVDRIINYGTAGSLSPEHLVNDVGFTKKIVHYDLDLSAGGKWAVGEYPWNGGIYLVPQEDAIPNLSNCGLKEFVCASADKFANGKEQKEKLRRDFHADICEMEAAGIVITCNKNEIPCTFIKSISDGFSEGAEAFDRNVFKTSKICAEAMMDLI